ncbi:putative D-aminoacylase [Fusarium acuminatum]|uniref:D-aminoacylase n=1 Tax=Fusarium acuminatum TaxID=5515 RepID=A0ABZ2WXN9_9HYPO
MADIAVRLRSLGSTIERLMSIAGTPGVSIGVSIKDKPVYYENHGYRNAFTAAAIGLLVDDEKLSWDSLIKDVLASFNSTDPILNNHTTLTDILSHRTGMGWGDNLILGTDGNVLLKSEDVMKYINNRTLIGPFRAQFGYSNLHYELAGRIIEHVSGQSYSEFVQSRLLKPLGLNRTSFQTPSKGTEGVAVCYNTLDDVSVAPINCPRMGDDWYGAASGGARSSVKDLASYGFGWGRVQLPGRLGQIGINPGLLPKGMPIIGKVSSDLKNDFVTLAEVAVAQNLKWYTWVLDELEKDQKSGTSPKALEEYVGTYWDDLHVVKIEVILSDKKLYWLIQGLESEKFALKHYQDDVFTWLQPRSDLSKRGRWVGSDQDAAFWKVEFKANESGQIDKLVWAHDGRVPPVTYAKV